MRVGYLGPPGTFSEAALRASVLSDGEHVPLPTIREVVLAVTGGDVGYAVVPFENSLEGSVNEALDALVHDAPGVRIVGETVLPVRYALIARDGVAAATAKVVVSHPQSLAQCARFVRESLPGAQTRAASSTAEAVRTAIAAEEPTCALGTELAAELYGGVVLQDGVEDDHSNMTRFVLLAGPGQAAPSDAGASWKSSVFFAGEGDSTPGWLLRCLAEFAERDVNLSRIESRPAKRRLGHYVFLVDVAGRGDEPGPAADAISALGEHCEEVRLLGAYPAAGG